MKRYKFLTIWALLSVLVIACNDDDDDKIPGNPVIADITSPSAAMFGDSIAFSAHVSDNQVALSTLKVYLYYGEEVVDEFVVRTKESGTYSGKLFAPFLANIPNGTATLKFVLQNIHMTIKEVDQDLPLTRPDFSYLTLQTADGEEYRMERTSLYNYEVTDDFPQQLEAYIIAPKVGTNGMEITFGWEDGQVKENAEAPIPFSWEAGEYTVKFNTYSYAASPFITILLKDKEMSLIENNLYQIDIDLDQNEEFEISGIPGDVSSWWIDPDYFELTGDNTLKFLPLKGTYRIYADFNHKYFRVQLLDGDSPAKFADGAIWLIGQGIGKPSLSNEVGWNEGNALCVTQKVKGKFQITLVAGESLNATYINFKFFGGQIWEDQFDTTNMSTTSDLIVIGDKEVNGIDDGNIELAEGKSFTAGKTYIFTIDTTGDGNAVLSIEEK